ncbi:flagellar motor protein MotB [Pseudolysinimonas sp.]|jgi:chemotaxis protein MotB|uniref:flagellar motor protein MotB n=1 Tax=Pseudolysinimonas sp. TaxID=2680009 RepID=UPI003784A7C3
MSRRRRGHAAHADGGGHGGGEERWMASYMDMVTVLMCLFIVLYAMSTVDAEKWETLKLSLATGFGVTQSDTVDTAEGLVVPEELVGEAGPSEGYAGYVPEPTEFEQMQQFADTISAQLGDSGLAAAVEFEIEDRGLVVKLTGVDTFFDGNSARLRPDALQVLNAIGPGLAASGRELSVEGHADPRFNPAPYETTWELAAARATSVLRYLVESSGMPAAHISGTTFGSAHPASDDPAQNRRVDIVVLTTDPEGLAQQLSQASEESSSGGTTSQGQGSGEPASTSGGKETGSSH